MNDSLDWSAKLLNNNARVQQRNEFIEQCNGKHLVEAEENLWVLSPQSLLGSINWLPDGALYDRMNHHNGRLLAAEIKAAVKQLKWTSYVLLNDNDMIQGFYLKELLKPQLYIYYLRDNFLAVEYWRRHGARLEPKLMSKVDLVASNSVYLANKAAVHNPQSIYIGQGCDLELFNPEKINEIPADIASIPKPRIGYAGALTGLRLDGELVEKVAVSHPEWQVVLIGDADSSFPKERLQTLPNVTFLGSKAPRQIPAYLEAMDVLINPQLLNEVTIGNYPRKIDEYLAMGKPVVAVRTETMSLFEKHVYLAETPNEFIQCIANVLKGEQLSSAEERIAFALEHTWENSMASLIDAIHRLTNSHQKTM